MSVADDHAGPGQGGPRGDARRRSLQALAASRPFQRWAARFPLTRWIVRREGAAMFDLVSGFCQSQILRAIIGLGIPDRLDRPKTLEALAAETAVPLSRLQVLLRGAQSLKLVRYRRGRWSLTVRGAALGAVPGLQDMIAHHDILYRDLADPVAFFRGETQPELAQFWPYVFGAGAATDPLTAERYSDLMRDSQVLVAEDTLSLCSLSGSGHLLDVGGGTGQFLKEVRAAHPTLELSLFDLPAVLESADLDRFDISKVPGSFRDDPLPRGPDVISLVRVLYDHQDETVLRLLRAVHGALPTGGRLIVSEPMAGSVEGNSYFALYCMAMETGRARTPSEISALLTSAGFRPSSPKSRRAFVTTVIESVKKG